MASNRADLRLRRCAIDFVGQQQIRENGSFNELELTVPRFLFLQNDRSRYIGRHQVRGELHSIEVQLQHAGQSPHQ